MSMSCFHSLDLGCVSWALLCSNTSLSTVALWLTQKSNPEDQCLEFLGKKCTLHFWTKLSRIQGGAMTKFGPTSNPNQSWNFYELRLQLRNVQKTVSFLLLTLVSIQTFDWVLKKLGRKYRLLATLVKILSYRSRPPSVNKNYVSHTGGVVGGGGGG